MAYQPIDNYALIGNMRTSALVGVNGSIDWLCFPHFDSPSIFAAILDDEQGGFFQISPSVADGVTTKQLYWPETNVLVTRFFTTKGVAELVDFMPVVRGEGDERQHRVVRRLTMVRGNMDFSLECRPAFDYARSQGEVVITGRGVIFRGPGLHMALSGQPPFTSLEAGDGHAAPGAASAFHLEENESLTFVLHQIPEDAGCSPAVPDQESEELFRSTVNFWRKWIGKSTYKGRWREMVHRSALTLKMLTFDPTGAIVAAPTAGLPEDVGGERNWDYRYTWIRDAAFTLYALQRIGFTEEAGCFMHWIEARTREPNPDGSLQIMYGIDGRHDLTETTLDHLKGYRGSRPVRVGNGACNQLQLDIYGELMDSVYLYNKHGAPISHDFWVQLRKLINWVVDNWQREDKGIWEMRGGSRHFTYSKLMCWVALDRGLRLAEKRSFPADRERWLAARDAVYEEIMTQGWNQDRGAFVQSYGSDALDASNLLMPLTFFVAPMDKRMLSTLDEILKPPQQGGLVSNSLTHRYNVNTSGDGLAGEEATFNICSFWLVEALTRAGRTDPKRLEDARLMFERMLGYANHVGLYSEETGPCGEALGNFPQAFTHLALISAAVNLDKELE
ncbi:Glucoamylase (glucan-1,4-alpha-glucosidase), GH15 family [Desulfonatronum thiosulfatophilum]|uniref:Glucoamylase (Glucan-1,4-alpha-glucosidase), GH15 family n=1 Tax=Desulfonatronum thiosulfatophilum TaxID=617002 RepID=A0A1G6AKG0_9BACT|nr:glycoside hydrolase family 15 protein [Desulfonatronum thiosulfatophilum]SDB08839.1 Glucoamylase (glucan-1,4-alpha-glucosidase), GH15 family [Desulfonatronum thiosulfatophilum]